MVVYLPLRAEGQNYSADFNLTSQEWKKKVIEDAGCPFIEEKQMLVRHVCLMPNYQRTEFPFVSESNRYITIELREVTTLHMDEDKNKLSLHIEQFYSWCDSRISANFSNTDSIFISDGYLPIIKLSLQNAEKIWHPNLDIQTRDLLDWDSLHQPDVFKAMFISSLRSVGKECENSLAVHAMKEWKATIYCKLDFTAFPFDVHNCSFIQELAPTSKAAFKLKYLDTLELEGEARGYSFKTSLIGIFDENISGNGTDEIGFNITLKRILSPYIYQYFLPSIACVLTTQVSFMIPLESITGRVSLIVTVLLALINILIDLFSHNPSGKTVNPLGIYLLVSLFFEMAVLLELGIVLIIRRRNNTKRNESKENDIVKKGSIIFADMVPKNPRRRFSITDKIDLGTFVVIMSLYLIFNCIFWTNYLSL